MRPYWGAARAGMLGHGRHDQGDQHQAQPEGARARQVVAAVAVQPAPDLPARQRAHQEGPQGRERGRHRQARCAPDGESQEHHVAGHVGHEHAAQGDEAHGVHHAGDHGQHQQQERQRAVARRAPRPESH